MPKAATKRQSGQSKATPSKRTKNPKDSHLYTDDNPASTIHGTGFKDKAAAYRTLELIKDRSLTYQFQTVNTMFHRAKHHPSMKKNIEGSANTQDMRDAMEIFRHWLDVTYPEQKDSLRCGGFKPLLSKPCVEKYLPQIQENDTVSKSARDFAKVYAELPKGKRLGNVLVDLSKPKEPDWERLRYDSLDRLIPDGKERDQQWQADNLGEEGGKLSTLHLELIAWAWSPGGESKLP